MCTTTSLPVVERKIPYTFAVAAPMKFRYVEANALRIPVELHAVWELDLLHALEEVLRVLARDVV